MTGTRYTPATAALLAITLPVLGFVVGYGYHTAQSVPPKPVDPKPVVPPGVAPPAPPTVKYMRVSPDGRTAAFTGVYDSPPRASRFLLDLRSGQWSAAQSPFGWQDITLQWSNDGSRILFDREKIPREVEESTGGLYQERVRTGSKPASLEAKPLTQSKKLPPGERSIAGLWTPDGELVVKTRREPKSLYAAGSNMKLLDRAAGTFLQNKAVRENGVTAYYVVRDIGEQIKTYALFRTAANGAARQLSEPLKQVEWAYVSSDGRWMVVCRDREDGDWDWTLYRVTPQKATVVKTQVVPGDVISVFWSPDHKHILGASGKNLWSIEVPSLQVSQLGERTDWRADDVAWLTNEKTVLVAADGILWKVAVPSGVTAQVWKFPAKYWK